MCTYSITCLKNISSYLQVPVNKIILNNEKMPTCSLNNKSVTGFVNIILTLLGQSKSNLLGANLEEEAEVRQWLEYCVTYASQYNNSQSSNQILQELNKVFSTRSYLVGHSLTIADVALFYVLQGLVEKLSYLDKEKFLNVSRWYDNLQQDNAVRKNKPLVDFSTIFLSCVSLK